MALLIPAQLHEVVSHLLLIGGSVVEGCWLALFLLGNLWLLGSDVLEDGETGLVHHGNVELSDVGVLGVLNSLSHDFRIFLEQILVGHPHLVEVAEVAL